MRRQRQASPLRLNALPGDTQANTGALDGAGAFGGTLKEWFKHALCILFGDGFAGVGNIDYQGSTLSAPHNIDDTPVWSIADRI